MGIGLAAQKLPLLEGRFEFAVEGQKRNEDCGIARLERIIGEDFMARETVPPVLVLSPHPDDETFGCGGTIRLLTKAGTPVDVVYLTRGELGIEAPETSNATQRQELAVIRTREAQAACEILGVRHVFFLDGADGQLSEHPQVARQLAALLRENNYQRVFCPGANEAHVDHQAAYRWFCQAINETRRDLDIWCYEVWTPLHPNMHVPIDETMPDKIKAAQAHASQLACLDYRSAFCGLAAYRSLACPPSKYAEAFFILHSKLLMDQSPL